MMATAVRQRIDDLDAAAYLARLAGLPRCAAACRQAAARLTWAAQHDGPELQRLLGETRALLDSLPL